MLSRYLKRLQDSLVERKATAAPSITPIVIVAVLAALTYIVLAIILVPSGEPREYHFINEHGATTAYSAIFLAASSALSFAAMTILRRSRDTYAWVWFILALGFAFLAFDELLEFHERVGRLIERVSESGVFRSWNDIIVIMYGVIALPILAGITPGLIRTPKVLELFAVGFLFYALHTLIDSISEPPTTYSVIAEESCKLLCGTFLAIGSYTGFLNAVWKDIPGPDTSANS